MDEPRRPRTIGDLLDDARFNVLLMPAESYWMHAAGRAALRRARAEIELERGGANAGMERALAEAEARLRRCQIELAYPPSRGVAGVSADVCVICRRTRPAEKLVGRRCVDRVGCYRWAMAHMPAKTLTRRNERIQLRIDEPA
jgi:hypothetical protein